MSITTKILADSRNPSGSRLTSFLLTYPRFIHAELNTHRAFSRNAASSRAIPIEKMIADVSDNPALPEFWAANQKGMAASTELTGRDLADAKSHWNNAREDGIYRARMLDDFGLHKGLANRRMEADMHITVLVTASDKGFANFFAQRAHPAAQPEFQVLAYRMLSECIKSKPKELQWGEWHIPEFGAQEIAIPVGRQTGDLYRDHFHVLSQEEKIKIATARCARLSYLTFDGEHSPEKDIELHDRLLTSGHFSPFEHCANAMETRHPEYEPSNFDSGKELCGWMQYRKLIQGENQTNVDLAAIMATKPEWITIP